MNIDIRTQTFNTKYSIGRYNSKYIDTYTKSSHYFVASINAQLFTRSFVDN